MPSARTWLRAIGNVKATAQTHHDIMVFTIKATQYVSGSAATAKLAEFDIIVRHNVTKKNLYERTKKAKLGSKVSIVGELDVYENKICVELHNFEFISNTNPYTTPSTISTNSSAYASPPSSASEKRTLLYSSLNQITNTNNQPKKLKTVENENKETNQKTASSATSSLNDSSTETTNQTDIPQTQPSHQPPRKRQLRSAKKISEIASTKLDFTQILN